MTANDAKQIIDVLSEKLGTTADQIFVVLTSQAKVYAIKNVLFCIAYLALIIITFVFVRHFFLIQSRQVETYSGIKQCTIFSKLVDDEELVSIASLIVIGILLVIISFAIILTMPSIISNTINAIFNPEFWAMNYLLELFM